MRSLFVVVVLIACGDNKAGVREIVVDAWMSQPDPGWCELTRSTCNPLTQAACGLGQKCTWLVVPADAGFVGHVGCAPDGNANLGESCSYAADGFDNCKRGLVCSAVLGGSGTCRQVCDLQGLGQPCGDADGCVSAPNLFRCGATSFAVAGICEAACDPLADNDFDGSGSAFAKMGTVCGTDPNFGCYGYPSFGVPPRTEWTCAAERNPNQSLHHRVECSVASGCADSNAFGVAANADGCSQGYLPLLYESTGSTTVVCVALCKPTNCFTGNCGTNDDNRLGVAPHRCNTTDRAGAFDVSAGGEHCQHLWIREVDETGQLLRSPTTDTVGVCVDHSKYRYDSNGDGTRDMAYPPCAALQDGYGSGTNPADPLTYFGAADLGCVDSSRAIPNRVPRGQSI